LQFGAQSYTELQTTVDYVRTALLHLHPCSAEMSRR
jgi:hypothetical protein